MLRVYLSKNQFELNWAAPNWHRRLDGHVFEQAPVVGDEQGSLVCCSPWGCKESDMT